MINSHNNMLLRIAQGDSYAMSCEYIKSPRDDMVLSQSLKFEKYVAHPTHTLKAGQYTDDTQMSIAVAEVLLSDGPHTREAFTDSFVNVFLRDPRDGYSRGFQSILNSMISVPCPSALFRKLVSPVSTKNGACMRAVPIGVIKSIPTLLEVARIQASVTHNTPEGIWSSQAVALMSHYSLYSDEPLSRMDEFLRSNLPGKISTVPLQATPSVESSVEVWTDQLVSGSNWNERVCGSYYPPRGLYGVGINTVMACYTAIKSNSDLIGIMTSIINWGGDTDSVAAIAWGIASSRMTQPLPDFFDRDLELGRKYGPSFLLDLGTQLMSKYNRIDT